MMGIKGALCLLVVSCSSLARAEKFLEHITSEEVQQQLHVQLRAMLGQGDVAGMGRLVRLQSQLKPLYTAMPKSADGGLEHGTARYALHRFFAHQHGWHVRGLEATGTGKWSDTAASTTMLEDRIPGYVLQLFEKHRRGRTGLRELAVLAATLEDVVHSETIQLLSRAYDAQSLSVEEALNAKTEHRVVTTYLLFHVMPNPQYAELSTAGLNHVLDRAPTFWKSYQSTIMWVRDLRNTMDHSEVSRQNPFVRKAGKPRAFSSLVRMVEDLGEHYGQFQNLECRGIKNALLDLSDGSGRVRLGKFYRAAFANQTSYFSESPGYLRQLGALDETESQQPSVIVTNYMYGRANCLASSGLYSICCIDECEPLLRHLERNIANPIAVPQRIAGLVAEMPSGTVSAPRNISAPMLRRLEEIARRHGGSIPLHGRLFAQWMHHAFPNECSYPHAQGSLASPVTPLGALPAEQEIGLHLKASKQEMQFYVDAALSLNASDPSAAAQEPPLPWTDEEELMVGAPAAHPMGELGAWLRLATLVIAILSSVGGLIRLLGAASALPTVAKKGKLEQHWA